MMITFLFQCFVLLFVGVVSTDAFGTYFRSISTISRFRVDTSNNRFDGSFQRRRQIISFPSSTYDDYHYNRRRCRSVLASSSGDKDDGGTKDGRPSVSLSGIDTAVEGSMSSPTAILDFILSLLTSDIGSIVLGSIGLTICLYNRLSSMDTMEVDALGQQSRSDLLAVFASGSVLLNGISKLDITSALAETVILDGITISTPKLLNDNKNLSFFCNLVEKKKEDLFWAVQSSLDSTPAKTVVVMVYSEEEKKWTPVIATGIIPQKELYNNKGTPILDRMMKKDTKESYLPTLQALPGKVEFTYLPSNTQLALILPIPTNQANAVALVLGSDTAKSFTPRDIAWCQVIATRMGSILDS